MRSISAIEGGGETRCFLLQSLKTISGDFFRLSVRLFLRAHASVFSISDMRELMLLAGTIRYVSSTNLHISLPGVTTFRSADVTTYVYHLHCRLLVKILRPVRMTREEICQPVVNLVWNIKLGQLLH